MSTFPNCLSIELSIRNKKQIFLIIRFGEENLPVPGGEISWGIRAGTLKLKFNNATLPLSGLNRDILSQLNTYYEREIQAESGTENEIGAEFPVKLIAKRREISKTSTKIKETIYLIHSGGPPEEPTWTFENPSYQQILKGMFPELLLGNLTITGKPVLILATFKVNSEDVRLTMGRGLWDRNIGANRLAWIERAIFLHLIKPQLQPYLSKIEVKP